MAGLELDSLEAGSRDDKIKAMLDNPVHLLHDELKHIATDGQRTTRLSNLDVKWSTSGTRFCWVTFIYEFSHLLIDDLSNFSS